MTDAEIIEVVAAHAAGKQIQRQFLNRTLTSVKPEPMPWVDCELNESYNFHNFVYRVKPEPRKPREWVVKVVGDGITSFWDGGRNISTYDIRVREVLE